MNKYIYTGPTMLLGENNEFELRNGMEVLAEVNINIAKVNIPVRMSFCLKPKEYEVEVAAKYLEPVKPETIDFTNDDDHEVGGNHYSKMVIEPWDYIYANKLGFDEGSVVKYISRHKDKNGAEDVKKVISFCKHILKTQYGED